VPNLTPHSVDTQRHKRCKAVLFLVGPHTIYSLYVVDAISLLIYPISVVVTAGSSWWGIYLWRPLLPYGYS